MTKRIVWKSLRTEARSTTTNMILVVIWPGPDNLFGYTGLGYDFASSNTYARARYYNPEIGRFISEDTYEGQINNPLSQNLYTYVHNNPLRYTDPDGHRFKGLDYSYGYFTLKYGFEMGTIADKWWDEDISDTEFLNGVGMNLNEWEYIDLSCDSSYDDSAEELKYTDEKNVAAVLSMMGKEVKTIKRTGDNTPDFLVDGVKVELKTAYPENGILKNKTSTQAVAKGFNDQKFSYKIKKNQYQLFSSSLDFRGHLLWTNKIEQPVFFRTNLGEGRKWLKQLVAAEKCYPIIKSPMM